MPDEERTPPSPILVTRWLLNGYCLVLGEEDGLPHQHRPWPLRSRYPSRFDSHKWNSPYPSILLPPYYIQTWDEKKKDSFYLLTLRLVGREKEGPFLNPQSHVDFGFSGSCAPLRALHRIDRITGKTVNKLVVSKCKIKGGIMCVCPAPHHHVKCRISKTVQTHARATFQHDPKETPTWIFLAP